VAEGTNPNPPQLIWTACWSRHWRVLGLSRRGFSGQRRCTALTGAAKLSTGAQWPATVTRTRSFPGTPDHAAISGPACTALGQQGHSVARAAGPRHHRPRLRHRPHRRDVQVTQSSRTSDRTCVPACAAARGPVSTAAVTLSPLDCPRCLPGCQAMLRPPVGAATRSNRCGALPHLVAPEGPHVLMPTAYSRLCLALPWHRRRRCGAGALAPPAPAITRGLPAPPRTAPPIRHGAAVGVCGPARLWTSVAGTARAGRARSCLEGLAWAGV
jgi:hypothetical protein